MSKFMDQTGVQQFATAIVGSTKTINGKSIWGSGNINVGSSGFSRNPGSLMIQIDPDNDLPSGPELRYMIEYVFEHRAQLTTCTSDDELRDTILSGTPIIFTTGAGIGDDSELYADLGIITMMVEFFPWELGKKYLEVDPAYSVGDAFLRVTALQCTNNNHYMALGTINFDIAGGRYDVDTPKSLDGSDMVWVKLNATPSNTPI